MKFLLIQFRQIGDVILTTPMIRLLKEQVENARIDFLTNQANVSLLNQNPFLDNIIIYSKIKGNVEFLKLLRSIRSNGYDAVLDFQDTPRSTYCAVFCGARYKVTYDTSSRRFFYNTLVTRKVGYATTIRSSLLTPFIPDIDTKTDPPLHPEIYFSQADQRKIEDLLRRYQIRPDDFIVTVSPTHRRRTRRWPLDFFYQAIEHLIRTYNAKVIVTWGPGEDEYIRQHPEFSNNNDANLIVDAELNLLGLTVLTSMVKLHIGNCSAPHHIATSQHTPTYIIFGSTSMGWCYPSANHHGINRNLDCQPCNKNVCIYGDAIPCLKEFPFNAIKADLDQFIISRVLPESLRQ
ncbi:MAG: glycosyltransferase family 9 protein [Desulfobacteraceae bacterium]|nr:glycosyltransferase family 9 protein [Desulfobacteraceae bacterium]